MFRYMFFLSRTSFKRVSPYLIPVITIVVFSLATILLISYSNTYAKESALYSNIEQSALILFIFSSLFSMMTIVHIFKQGEIDGSEIIIVAKPITRKEILGAKFLMSLIMIILFHLVMLINFTIIASMDDYASKQEKINWIFSLLLGGFFIQLIVSSIIILLTSIFGRIGTIVVTLLMASILPVLSTILQSFGSPFVPYQAEYNLSSVNSYEKDKNLYIDDEIFTDEILDNPTAFRKQKNIVISNANQINYPSQKKYFQAEKGMYEIYKKNNWYKNAVYVDLWYQWGRFYSVFVENKSEIATQYNDNLTKKIDLNLSHFSQEDKFYIDDTEYVFLDSTNNGYINSNYEFDNDDKFGENYFGIGKEIAIELDIKYKLHQLLKDDEFKIVYQQESDFLKKILYINSPTEIDYIKENFNKDTIQYYVADIENYFPAIIKTYITLDKKWNINSNKIDINSFNQYFSLEEVGIYNNETLVKNSFIYNESYMPTNLIIVIWIFLSLMLMGGAVLIYAYRDFK